MSRVVGVSLTPDETYDAAVTATLPGLSAGLAALFAVLVPLHLLMLDGTPRIVMTACAAGQRPGWSVPSPSSSAGTACPTTSRSPPRPAWCSSPSPTPSRTWC